MTDPFNPIPWAEIPPAHQRRLIVLLGQLAHRHWQPLPPMEDPTDERSTRPAADEQR